MSHTEHRRARLELNADFDALITDISIVRVDEHGKVRRVNPKAMPTLHAEGDDEWRTEFARWLGAEA